MKIQRCKGMRDLSPAEMTVFRLVEGICSRVLSEVGVPGGQDADHRVSAPVYVGGDADAG